VSGGRLCDLHPSCNPFGTPATRSPNPRPFPTRARHGRPATPLRFICNHDHPGGAVEGFRRGGTTRHTA